MNSEDKLEDKLNEVFALQMPYRENKSTAPPTSQDRFALSEQKASETNSDSVWYLVLLTINTGTINTINSFFEYHLRR